MTDHTSKRPIPLKQRFVTGVVGTKGAAVLYVDFPEDYHWARSAKVTATLSGERD